MSATGVLFVVLLAFGAVGWSAVPTSPVGEVQWPGWIFLPLFGALGVAFLTIFKPHLARFTSFGYAALEGWSSARSPASTTRSGTASSCKRSC